MDENSRKTLGIFALLGGFFALGMRSADPISPEPDPVDPPPEDELPPIEEDPPEEDLSELYDRIKQVQDEIAELETGINELDRELAEIQALIQQELQRIKQLAESIGNLLDVYNQIAGSEQGLQEDVAFLEEIIAALEAGGDIEGALAALRELASRIESRILDLQQAKEELQRQIDALLREIDELEFINDSLYEAVQDARSQIETLQGQIATLTRRVDELEYMLEPVLVEISFSGKDVSRPFFVAETSEVEISYSLEATNALGHMACLYAGAQNRAGSIVWGEKSVCAAGILSPTKRDSGTDTVPLSRGEYVIYLRSRGGGGHSGSITVRYYTPRFLAEDPLDVPFEPIEPPDDGMFALFDRIMQAEADIAALEAEIDHLNVELGEVHKLIQQEAQLIKRITQGIRGLLDVYNQIADTNRKMQEDALLLESIIAALESGSGVSDALESLKEFASRFQARIEELQQAKEELQRQIESILSEVEELERLNDRLYADVEDYRSRIQELETHIENISNRIAELEYMLEPVAVELSFSGKTESRPLFVAERSDVEITYYLEATNALGHMACIYAGIKDRSGTIVWGEKGVCAAGIFSPTERSNGTASVNLERGEYVLYLRHRGGGGHIGRLTARYLTPRFLAQ